MFVEKYSFEHSFPGPKKQLIPRLFCRRFADSAFVPQHFVCGHSLFSFSQPLPSFLLLPYFSSLRISCSYSREESSLWGMYNRTQAGISRLTRAEQRLFHRKHQRGLHPLGPFDPGNFPCETGVASFRRGHCRCSGWCQALGW